MGVRDSHITVSNEGDICRIGFVDRNILEENNIQSIGAEIGRLVDQAANLKMLISFKDVEHLSSAALGALITINHKVKEKGGQLRLSDIDPRVYEIFLITKLNTLFQIHETAQKAIESFD